MARRYMRLRWWAIAIAKVSPINKLVAVEQSSRSRQKASKLLLLLIFIVLLTLGRICGHGFTGWDDTLTISQNLSFNPPTLQGVLHYWYTPELSLYIPVTYCAWGALAFLSSIGAAQPTPNPWIFHTASVLVHATSALVVFLLLMRLLRNASAAFLGAAIFAVHPLQVEAVAWASGLKDLLCGFFSIAAIFFYVTAVQNQHRRRTSYALGMISLGLALLSKPTAIATPLLVWVVDYWLLRRTLRENIKWLWPWFVMVIPIAVIARVVQDVAGVPLTPLWTRPLVYSDAMAFYLWKIFWPVHLGIDYARTPVYAMQQGWIYWTWILPAVVAALVFVSRRRWLIGGSLLFLVGWLPVSGLSGFLFQYYSTVADHYMYLPMLGVAVAAAYRMNENPNLTKLLASVVVLLGVGSFVQAGYWRDDRTLYEHVLAISPRSHAAHTNLARLMMAEGDCTDAERELDEATRLQPTYYQGWESLAQLQTLRGRFDLALAAEKRAINARKALPARTAASFPSELDFYGELLMKNGQRTEAIQQFERAIALNANFEQAKKDLRKAMQTGPTTR